MRKFLDIKNALPFIFIITGLFSLIFGIWGNFENNLWRETWVSVGKTILASGIFASILKLMQISGVFKEELEKLIFEPKYLKNRKDLIKYWEGVSLELFKNKFPKISKKLLDGIKDVYLPTKNDAYYYYDELEHHFEVELDDNTIKLKYHTTLNVFCDDRDKKIKYKFANAIEYNKSKEEITHTSEYIKVNGTKIDNFSHSQEINEKQISNIYVIELEGSTKYEIERLEIKQYELENNEITYFKAIKLTNGIKVTVTHPATLNVTLRKMGGLDEFVLKQTNNTFKKYECKGLIYPEQGYMVHFKKIVL